MSIIRKIKRAVRGEVDVRTGALEIIRRNRVALARTRERASLRDKPHEVARLRAPHSQMSPAELVHHFRTRSQPVFFHGFVDNNTVSGVEADPIAAAEQILKEHRWPLLGCGPKSFGMPIDWNRDPLSGFKWPLDYHADIPLSRNDGSDVRVLWELNRMSHLLTLGRAYAMTGDNRFAVEYLEQLSSWREQNPYGYGVNWNCAMEVALRAINLLGAFEIFRKSSVVDERTLPLLLAMLDQHGSFISDHLEFSYIATSNHYLSDVVGLAWLGLMLPELAEAATWRDFGLRETLNEMEKQVLPDGADFESSTGYHRFVLEMLLYTFVLYRANGIEFESTYSATLRRMLQFLRGYLRPDGRSPLIGDTDGGQVFPLCLREADDHAYLLALGATVFKDGRLKIPNLTPPPELRSLLGHKAVDEFLALQPEHSTPESIRFPEAGICVLRCDDLYLCLIASDAGLNGRGSHGHNDALSIELSACGVPFIVDPGTYVYTGDLDERHRFRSTAYHSTVQIDDHEQNTIQKADPFVVGNEAQPRIVDWHTGVEIDRVSAEHFGYRHLPEPVVHKRTIIFNKPGRWWLIEDEFLGAGEHSFATRFHFNAGLSINRVNDQTVNAVQDNKALLSIHSLDIAVSPAFEDQFVSTNYLKKLPSTTACWHFRMRVPARVRWLLIPVYEPQNAEPEISLRYSQALSFIGTQKADM